LEEDGDTVFRRWLPALAHQSPKIKRKRLLFCELDADHREGQSLTLVGAHEEMRDDHVLDVGRVKF
jgi:hypothetical protein